MATKAIKFTDNITTYLPVTDASLVQFKNGSEVKSVADAILEKNVKYISKSDNVNYPMIFSSTATPTNNVASTIAYDSIPNSGARYNPSTDTLTVPNVNATTSLKRDSLNALTIENGLSFNDIITATQSSTSTSYVVKSSGFRITDAPPIWNMYDGDPNYSTIPTSASINFALNGTSTKIIHNIVASKRITASDPATTIMSCPAGNYIFTIIAVGSKASFNIRCVKASGAWEADTVDGVIFKDNVYEDSSSGTMIITRTGTLASDTKIYLYFWEPDETDYYMNIGHYGYANSPNVKRVGITAVTNDYNDLDNKPTIPENTDHYDKIYNRGSSTNTGFRVFSVETVGTATGSTTGDYYVPLMTASQLGVAKTKADRSTSITATVGGDMEERYYGVEKDSNNQLFVNVPWKDYDNLLTGAMHMKGGTTVGPASNVTYIDGDTYIYNPSNATMSYTIPAELSINGSAQILSKGDTFTYSASAKKWTVLENNNEVATTGTLGLVKSSTTGTTANRYYNVQVNTDGTMKVNVPWTDNATTLSGHYTPTAPTAGTNQTSTGSVNIGGTFTEISYLFDSRGHRTANVTKTWTINAPSTKQLPTGYTFTSAMKYVPYSTTAQDLDTTWLSTIGTAGTAVAIGSISTVGTSVAYVKS